MAGPKTQADVTSQTALTALRRQIRLSWLAIAVERFARAFWPVVSLVLLAYGLFRWGLFESFQHLPLLASVAALSGGLLYLVTRGARQFQFPGHADAVRRLDSVLDGRPLQALGDSQAIGADDPASQAVWALHLHRMADAAQAARAHEPAPMLSRRDPWALRLMALLVFVSALAFTTGKPARSLIDSLQGVPPDVLATGPAYEAWAEPPAYTGKPTIYLNAFSTDKILQLPVGTRMILRVYGRVSETALQETISHTGGLSLPQSEAELSEIEFDLVRDGTLTLSPRGAEPVSWTVKVIDDLAPEVALTDEISRSLQGSMQIPYQAKDDYGIEGGQVTVGLDLSAVDRRHGLTLDPESRPQVSFDIQLPFRGSREQIEDIVVEELAEHPWAGLPVVINFSVFDARQNTSAIDPVHIAMPGKRFFDPLAGSIAEQRRDLLWNRNNADRVGMILKAVTTRPDGFFDNETAYLMTRTAIRRLDYAAGAQLDDTLRDDVAELLWQAALLIEDGDLGDAAERLKRAQERLSDAMKNGATDDEIQQLMDELRQATRDYMRQLAENAERNPDRQQSSTDPSRTVTPDMIQELMNRIQELMEQGRMDEAAELLQQLQQMMENMQVVEGGQGQDGDQNRQGMQDTLRQQQELADETFRRMQEEFNRQRQQGQDRQQDGQDGQQQGQQGGQQPGQQPGQNRLGQDQGQGQDRGGSRPGDLADRQEALRQMLQGQRGQIPQDGSDPSQAGREALEQAERNMGAAREGLENGDTAGALDSQADAIEALREGLRNLDEAARQAEQQNGQQPGQGNGPVTGQASRDPLGRPLGGNGSPGSNEKLLPEEELHRQSRELRNEIRKRSGEQERPRLELDYLQRLLERF